MVELDGSCALNRGPGIDLLFCTVTVLFSIGVEQIGCVGRYLCCRLWVWNRLVCWTVTVL
jgi:hypothetical protein